MSERQITGYADLSRKERRLIKRLAHEGVMLTWLAWLNVGVVQQGMMPEERWIVTTDTVLRLSTAGYIERRPRALWDQNVMTYWLSAKGRAVLPLHRFTCHDPNCANHREYLAPYDTGWGMGTCPICHYVASRHGWADDQ